MEPHDPYVVIVEFSLKPSASKAESQKLLVQNAVNSLQNEPGCHRFDVVETNDAKVPFVLYELYQDETAFVDHLNSPHYLEFNEAADQYFEDKNVRVGSLANSASNLVKNLENE